MAAARRSCGSNASGTAGQSRQLPGAACEECRKRKLRCKASRLLMPMPFRFLLGANFFLNQPPTGDRGRPQCGTCADAGIVCEVNTNRLARGPKKGDLKALRSRIGELPGPSSSLNQMSNFWSSSGVRAPSEPRPDGRRPHNPINPCWRRRPGYTRQRLARGLDAGRRISSPHVVMSPSEVILGQRTACQDNPRDAYLDPPRLLDVQVPPHAAFAAKRHLCG